MHKPYKTYKVQPLLVYTIWYTRHVALGSDINIEGYLFNDL